MLTPYQFASNTPIQAVDLDGLEAFVIHGTTQTKGGISLSDATKQELLRITGNSKLDDGFRWDAPIFNSQEWRTTEAKKLVEKVIEVRAKMLADGSITEDEGISLIGYSHGGNVAIQAADMLNDNMG